MCVVLSHRVRGILLSSRRKAVLTSKARPGGGAQGSRSRALGDVSGGGRRPSWGLFPASLWPHVFQERYTCPSLASHPREPVFLAQTNGNYLALFSAVWPYRMSRRRRYEGHKVLCSSAPCQNGAPAPEPPPDDSSGGLGAPECTDLLSGRILFSVSHVPMCHVAWWFPKALGHIWPCPQSPGAGQERFSPTYGLNGGMSWG